MDTLQNSLPDEEFFNIQIKLRKWMQRVGFVNWKQIQKACRNLLASYPNDYADLYGNFPEYKLFMPLLRNGICEISKQNGKTGFVILPKDNIENPTIEPLLLLNNFPSISDIISAYRIEDSVEIKFYCDLYDKYTYKINESNKFKIGIYKPEDKVYSSAFIFDGIQQRLIPSYEENPDSINIARCYVRCSDKQKLFVYHSTKKELNVLFYSELPILITRALILFDEKQLKEKRFKYPLDKATPYKNIEMKAINELIRIFGKDSIEVQND